MPRLTRMMLLLCLAACDTFAAPGPKGPDQDAPPPLASRPPSPTMTAPAPPPGVAGCIGCVKPPVLDAGARCPSGFLIGQDADGLSTALEQDAGLDPCKLDTDADGCNDAAEFYLRGCDDPHNAVLEQRCYAMAAMAEVSYVLPMNAGPWSKVTLTLPKAAPARVYALEATPVGSGAVNGDEFLKVQPGATLRFHVVVQEPSSLLTRGTLRVMADDQQVGSGELLITPLPECPIPI